jgi:hypothetical protein
VAGRRLVSAHADAVGADDEHATWPGLRCSADDVARAKRGFRTGVVCGEQYPPHSALWFP